MEDTEKMTALKKAYAEIILNTAKEAAARIMASERKANQYKFDLSATREEALRLVLRLKQSMDTKINEAEMKSLNQQRRIEELEAQLQEAEDIVSNLRAELNDAHTKLEDLSNNQINHAPNTTEKVHSEEGAIQPDNVLAEAILAGKTNSIIKSANGQSITKDSLEENGHSGDPGVPSIIMRSKKPELYRNGCTQRIHAYEGNLVNGYFPPSGELDDQKYEKAIREDKEGEGICVTPIGADTTLCIRKEKQRKRAAESNKKRKRAARCKRGNVSALNSIPLLGTQAVPDLPEHLATVKGDETEAHMVVNEDAELDSSFVSIRQTSISGDCLDESSLKQELEMKCTSSVNPDPKLLEAANGFPSPPPKDRVLKYTFQRKRKKESLSGDDSTLHQENPPKRKMTKEENDNLEAPISSSVAESSRDSRRMAQVARQLLCLSEKKWWK